MRITESWLDLKVNRYEDGNYEAYEALSDSQYETSNWCAMRQWLRQLIDDTTCEIEASQARTEGK